MKCCVSPKQGTYTNYTILQLYNHDNVAIILDDHYPHAFSISLLTVTPECMNYFMHGGLTHTASSTHYKENDVANYAQ